MWTLLFLVGLSLGHDPDSTSSLAAQGRLYSTAQQTLYKGLRLGRTRPEAEKALGEEGEIVGDGAGVRGGKVIHIWWTLRYRNAGVELWFKKYTGELIGIDAGKVLWTK